MEVPRDGGDGKELTTIEAEECNEEEVVGGWIVEQAIVRRLGLFIFLPHTIPLILPFAAYFMCVALYILRYFGFFVVVMHFTLGILRVAYSRHGVYSSSLQASSSDVQYFETHWHQVEC